jgi:hypothetical protein
LIEFTTLNPSSLVYSYELGYLLPIQLVSLTGSLSHIFW